MERFRTAVHAVALYESNLNPSTIATTGAIGLMALQPDIARQLSIRDPFNPSSNVDGGTRLLQQLSQDFQGNLDLILAGYNAGSDPVELSHGVPPFRETTDYVKHVGHIYKLCRAEPQAFSTLNPNEVRVSISSGACQKRRRQRADWAQCRKSSYPATKTPG